MKRFLMALAVSASVFAMAPSAQAATFVLNDTLSQSLGDTDVGIFFGQHAPSSSFTDNFKFTLSSSLSDVVTFGFVPVGSFSSLNLKLFNATTSSYVAPAAGTPLTTAYTFSGLQNGNDYRFEVSGLTGNRISTFSGTASVSAVPLPAALPLFGAGLGALGLMWRRRRQDQAAA